MPTFGGLLARTSVGRGQPVYCCKKLSHPKRRRLHYQATVLSPHHTPPPSVALAARDIEIGKDLNRIDGANPLVLIGSF